MHFHHLHFYVENAANWRDWFIQVLAFRPLTSFQQADRQTEVLIQGAIQIRLSEPSGRDGSVARYLQAHPPGVADIAFAVTDLDAWVSRARAQGARLPSPAVLTSFPAQPERCCQIQGWGDLCHTLVEVDADWLNQQPQGKYLSTIDHAVLNVPEGQLAAAIAWYATVFGFEPRQSFTIETAHSGLCSQVIGHPDGTAQLPINQPSSPNSQIQEFLTHNRGGGIQHVALGCMDMVSAIAAFRDRGLPLISVLPNYYETLKQRSRAADAEIDWSAIATQSILVDWAAENAAARLLQTFTQPIFAEPTFFFEFIQRSRYRDGDQVKTAQGFGEGNFRALFEAIERAQIQRGSL